MQLIENLSAKTGDKDKAQKIIKSIKRDWLYVEKHARHYSFEIPKDVPGSVMEVLNAMVDTAVDDDLLLLPGELYIPDLEWVEEIVEKVNGTFSLDFCWRVLYTYGVALYRQANSFCHIEEMILFVQEFCPVEISSLHIALLIDLENCYAAKLDETEENNFAETLEHWAIQGIDLKNTDHFTTSEDYDLQQAVLYVQSILPDNFPVDAETIKIVLGLIQWGYHYLKGLIEEVFFPDCREVGGILFFH